LSVDAVVSLRLLHNGPELIDCDEESLFALDHTEPFMIPHVEERLDELDQAHASPPACDDSV
jgi:hypothetical protein